MKDYNNQIIDAIESGDQQVVLELLYKKVLPNVIKYIRSKKGSLEDAKDVFQDAVIVFIDYVKKQKYDKTKPVDSFIFITAKYLWINKIKRDSKLTELSDERLHDTITIIDRISNQERSRAIVHVLNSAGDRCKELLKLIWFESFSLKKAAELMGLPSEDAAKSNAYRCKKLLKRFVEKNPSYRDLLRSE